MEANLKTREEILKAGTVDIKVRHVGIIQFREFTVKRLPSPIGEYPILFIDRYVDVSECIRVAEEVQLPVQTKNGVFFPKGTASKDFVGL